MLSYMKMPETISTELLAAYLDGNATAVESRKVLSALGNDEHLQEMMMISQAIDDELDMCIHDAAYRPVTAMAASCGDENYCCLECEKYILTKRGIWFDERELLATSLRNRWQEEKGTALFNIGRHLENRGLEVERRLQATLDDIAQALADGADVIAVVDGGELIGDRVQEQLEDIFIGPIPDHSVVVVRCDRESVTIFDPDSPSAEDTYPLEQFLDAWDDSRNYMVVSR